MLTTGQIERAVEDMAADLRMSRDLRAKADEAIKAHDYKEQRRCEDAAWSWISQVRAKCGVLRAMFGEAFAWNVEDSAYIAVYGEYSPESFCYKLSSYPNVTLDPDSREQWEALAKQERDRRTA